MGKDRLKDGSIAVRLSQEEIEQLDVHTQKQLSRSMILRILVQDFLKKPVEEQRWLLIDSLL